MSYFYEEVYSTVPSPLVSNPWYRPLVFFQWSGKFRYTLYQGTYVDAGAADCQLKFWAQVEEGSQDMWMNKTYR
jgi:hypothetical protein